MKQKISKLLLLLAAVAIISGTITELQIQSKRRRCKS